MGRELRKVPAGWEHPLRDCPHSPWDGGCSESKKHNGKCYQPMFNRYYGDAIKEWITGHELWLDGTHPDLQRDPILKDKYPFYAMYHGGPPDVEYYQTKKYSPEELTHIQLYQTTSEGTPLSPVFHASEFEKLCEWAAVNATTFAQFKTSKEEWMRMLSNDLVYHQRGNMIFI